MKDGLTCCSLQGYSLVFLFFIQECSCKNIVLVYTVSFRLFVCFVFAVEDYTKFMHYIVPIQSGTPGPLSTFSNSAHAMCC